MTDRPKIGSIWRNLGDQALYKVLCFDANSEFAASEIKTVFYQKIENVSSGKEPQVLLCPTTLWHKKFKKAELKTGSFDIDGFRVSGECTLHDTCSIDYHREGDPPDEWYNLFDDPPQEICELIVEYLMTVLDSKKKPC